MSFAYQLSRFVQARIVGQEVATQQVVRALVPRLFNDLPQEKTQGEFLLVGPPGTGKTHLAECLAEFFLGDANRLIRINPLVLQEPIHNVSFLHHRIRPVLPTTGGCPVEHVVLIEHVEKSSKILLDFWTSIFTNGFLHQAAGAPLSFRNTLFLLKAAVGEKQVDRLLGVVGFGGADERNQDGEVRELISRSLEETFPNRFLTSVTKIVHFRQLHQDDIEIILDRLLDEYRHNLERSGVQLRFDQWVREYLLQRNLQRTRFGGAKGLRRVIVDELLYPIDDLLLSGKLIPPASVWVKKGDQQLIFCIPERSGPAVAMPTYPRPFALAAPTIQPSFAPPVAWPFI